MLFSVAYSFIRARQLEGTYPGDPRLGVWGITSNRVRFGWGRVAEEFWPHFQPEEESRDFHAPEPPGVGPGCETIPDPAHMSVCGRRRNAVRSLVITKNVFLVF